MAAQDHYQVLGLTNKATPEEVKRRFRELARRWHPDVSKSDDASERFKAINEAYRVLGDPERRAHYDAEIELARMRRTSTASPRAKGSARTSSTNPSAANASERSGSSGASARRATDQSARTYAIGRLLQDAQAAMAGMRLNEAAGFCRAVLELDRRNAGALEILGDIHRYRGHLDQALAYYTMAIQTDPTNARLRAKFERLAAEPFGAAPPRAATSGAMARQAVVLMIGVLAVGLIVVLNSIGPKTEGGVGWAIWDWSPGILLGLPAAGFVAGLAGAWSGYLGPARQELLMPAPGAGARSAVPMGLILIMLSLVCFWISGILYLAAAAAQDAVSRSIVFAFMACGAIVALFALVSDINWGATALLGGNLAFPAYVAGWIAADGGRR